jgi:hypothetical protein
VINLPRPFVESFFSLPYITVKDGLFKFFIDMVLTKLVGKTSESTVRRPEKERPGVSLAFLMSDVRRCG